MRSMQFGSGRAWRVSGCRDPEGGSARGKGVLDVHNVQSLEGWLHQRVEMEKPFVEEHLALVWVRRRCSPTWRGRARRSPPDTAIVESRDLERIVASHGELILLPELCGYRADLHYYATWANRSRECKKLYRLLQTDTCTRFTHWVSVS